MYIYIYVDISTEPPKGGSDGKGDDEVSIIVVFEMFQTGGY